MALRRRVAGRLLVGAGALGAAAAVAAAVAARRRDDGPVSVSARWGRRAELAGMGSRMGRRWAMHRARRVFADAERREQLDTEYEMQSGEEVARTLGNMKGALMKIGQMASYLDDGLPQPMRDALAQLQQDAPPMSPELAAGVVEKELGGLPDKVFAEWDPVPMAAASIGQVHRAITHDGVAVAVKVQYPGVDQAIRSDLDNAEQLLGAAGFVFHGFEPGPFVEELRARLIEELDYVHEAENQRLFADYYRGHPFIHVPDVVDPLSTGRVLTTELATGARFSDLDGWTQEERNLAGEAIYRFVFRSLYRLRAFNGDPHPGNYLFRPGGDVTFLDFGLVRHFQPEETRLLQSMVETLVLGRDPAAFRRIVEDAGVLKPGAPFGNDRVQGYFGHFYEVVLEERTSRITHEYAAATVRRILDLKGEYGDVLRWANLPPMFVILQRINLGMYAVLAQLGATANWRRIAEELWPMVNGPPSTELGHKEAAWLASKTAQHA